MYSNWNEGNTNSIQDSSLRPMSGLNKNKTPAIELWSF